MMIKLHFMFLCFVCAGMSVGITDVCLHYCVAVLLPFLSNFTLFVVNVEGILFILIRLV